MSTLKMRPWWSMLLILPGTFLSQWQKHNFRVAWLTIKVAFLVRWEMRNLDL